MQSKILECNASLALNRSEDGTWVAGSKRHGTLARDEGGVGGGGQAGVSCV